MMWNTIAKAATILGMLGGAVWVIGDAAYDKGYANGYEKGHEEGTRAANQLRDAQFERQMAEHSLEAERKLRAANDRTRELEKQYEDQRKADRKQADEQLQSVVNSRDRINRELRDARAQRAAIRSANGGGGLSSPAGTVTAGTLSTGILSERAEGRIIGFGSDAENLNIWYGQCRRAYDGIRSGKVIPLPSQ